jgi:hypothetical protein
MGARDFLRSIYASLPVIRELRRTAAAAEGLVGGQWHIQRRQMTEYEERLLQSERYADPRNLNRHEFQVFSQFGEDGISAEIFRRIGTTNRAFLEIGIGDGLQNNSAFLLFLGWSGAWIDADEKSIATCKTRFADLIAAKRLSLQQAFVSSENVVELVEGLGVPRELDLFSLDIDRNTYYVWQALEKLRPRVAVVEYNPAIPAQVDWKVEYNARLSWNNTIYYGASLKALELLGKRLGYSLVGCSIAGVNAFFVRDDLMGDLFEPPFTAEKHFEPFRPFLERRKGFALGFNDRWS